MENTQSTGGVEVTEAVQDASAKPSPKKALASGGTRKRESFCCVCGSDKLALGILYSDRPMKLAAFPKLKRRKRFPLCEPCRSKIRWIEVEEISPSDTPARSSRHAKESGEKEAG